MGTAGLQAGAGGEGPGGFSAGIYSGNLPEPGLCLCTEALVVAQGTDVPTVPAAAPGSACRDGHRQLKAQEKQEAARLWSRDLSPRTEDAVGSSRKGAEQPGGTSDTEEFAEGISHALPGIFPLWRDLMGPRKEHGSLMSSKAQAKAADPSCSCPSRNSPARKAVPGDGQSQLSFPKPSGEQVRAGR